MAKYYSPAGNIEVWDEKPDGYYTVEEWQEMHPIPPYIPTKDEKIEALDAEYTREKATLCEQYTDAQIHGDTDTAEAIVSEMNDLDALYDEEYEKIINDEGSEE